MNIEKGKVLHHSIHMEEQILHLFESLEDQGEISEKKRYISLSKPRVYMYLVEFITH